MTRRTALQAVAAAGAGGLLAGCSIPRGSQANPIELENRRHGTRDWMIQNTRTGSESKYRCEFIEGYASRTSVRAGDQISFHVSTRPRSAFHIEIYRSGYYAGSGGRFMKKLGPFHGVDQHDPPVGQKRVRHCDWSACATLTIPRDWVSGVYLAKLTEHREGLQSYIIFIVTDDRQADFIFQCSDNTWQAYNRWPSQYSLYDDGQKEWFWGSGSAVSFNRPYGRNRHIVDNPLSTGSGEWFLWEFPVAFWLESQGYDITYISNHQTHADPKSLMRASGFLSVGHDEYYTLQMYQNLKTAIAQGLNVAFLSGNTCCGRVEFLDVPAARAGRIFERVDIFARAYEEAVKVFPEMKALRRESPADADLIGAGTVWPYAGNGDWVCSLPDHWMFAGTGMKAGESVPGLVGWEYHGDPAKIPGLEVISTGPAHSGIFKPGTYTGTIYPGGKNNFVFNASTIWWGDGLSEPPGYVRPKAITSPKGPDPRIQRITRNLLDRMRGGRSA